VTDRGAVELEGAQAKGLGGHESVGARWRASQAFPEDLRDRYGPDGGVAFAGDSLDPQNLFLEGSSRQKLGGKSIEASSREAQLRGRGCGRERTVPAGREHLADERRGRTM
jgi:hypothetical protein